MVFNTDKKAALQGKQGRMASETLARQRGSGQGANTEGKKANESTLVDSEKGIEAPGFMKRFFGFDFSDLSSFSRFTKLLSRPMDPAGLGFVRLVFGLLMILDIPQERGMAEADLLWRNEDLCYFPLFDFLKPLSLEWMLIVYLFLCIGAFGIMLGLFYRLSCLLFLVPYWYLFLLNKQRWNHHSYLFGLLAFMFLLMDGDRYWSLDGLRNSKIRNAEVPLWNYLLLRFQNFLIYLVAGLKKMDPDWLGGYSLSLYLGSHPVFAPFRLFLTPDQVNLYIVHYCGFAFDLTVGFFLFFDVTRVYALWFCGSFHLINSVLFRIGMFPWMMLAMMSVFCYPNWPWKLLRKTTRYLRFLSPVDSNPQPSDHCLYEKEAIKPEQDKKGSVVQSVDTAHVQMKDKPGFYHKVAATFTMCYILTQCFLPYSHFLTKGYNNWRDGLYGYSWDMMVGNWNYYHRMVSYTSKQSNQTRYLHPSAYLAERNRRWSSHADMVKQYARCLSEKLARLNITDAKIYFNVWQSMNKRFIQRVYDPKVDIVAARWSPFERTSWILPLHTDLSSWQRTLVDKRKSLIQSQNLRVIFVADFPGFEMENYVYQDLEVNLTVMKGSAMVRTGDNGTEVYLKEEATITLPNGTYHTVRTVSNVSACYMYMFKNATEVEMLRNETGGRCEINENPGWLDLLADFLNFLFYFSMDNFHFVIFLFYRSFNLCVGAIYSIATKQPLNTTGLML